MFLRHVLFGLGATALFVLIAGAASAQAPVDTTYAEETVESTMYFAETNSSQGIAFATRVLSIVGAAAEGNEDAANAAAQTISDAAIQAETDVAAAVAEGNPAALGAALTQFNTAVSGALGAFQAATIAESTLFTQETNAEAQLFVTVQRDAMFDFSAAQRSSTADFGTDGVTIVTSTSELLAAVVFASGVEGSTILFETSAGTFLVANELATGNVVATLSEASSVASLGLDSLGAFRANRFEQIGGTSGDAQYDTAQLLNGLTSDFSSNRATVQDDVIEAAGGASELASGTAIEQTGEALAGLRTVQTQYQTASTAASGNVDAAAVEARSIASGGAAGVFERISQA